jgi:hypothetical protein
MTFKLPTKITLLSLIFLLFDLAPAYSGTTTPLNPVTPSPISSGSIPPSYQQEYSTFNHNLDVFITDLDKVQSSNTSPTYTAELLYADGNRGTQLLAPNAMTGVVAEMKALQKLGIQAVVIRIGFPMCVPQFYQFNGDPNDQLKFLTFYQNVVRTAHSMGMKVLVESGPLQDSVPGLNVAAYYHSLNGQLYSSSFAQHNTNVAGLGQGQALPDVVSLCAEPDTDYALTGQAAYNSPQGFGQLIAASVNSVIALPPGSRAKLAAGAPEWEAHAQSFDQQLLAIQGVDFIDIHIYDGNDLPNALSLAEFAKANGKPSVISECWLAKGAPGTIPPPLQPQNAFSFWIPLDKKFLYAISQMCKKEQIQYMAPFWSSEFLAYLNYATDGSLNNNQLTLAEEQAAAAAEQAGQFSATGIYYGKIISGTTSKASSQMRKVGTY